MPKLIEEDMGVMNDFELLSLCKAHKVSGKQFLAIIFLIYLSISVRYSGGQINSPRIKKHIEFGMDIFFFKL